MMHAVGLQVCLYAFDCLHLNGETLIQRPLTERRAALAASIEEREGELLHAKTLVGFWSESQHIHTIFNASIEEREGELLHAETLVRLQTK